MNRSKQKTSRGFTLIEIMITLTVFAVLAALAAPSLSGFIVSSRLTGYANDVLGALNLARAEAIRRGQRVVMCPVNLTSGAADVSACVNPGTGAWNGWMIFQDTTANGALDAGAPNNEVAIRAGTFGGGSSVVRSSPALSGVGNLIVFRPDGIAKAQGGQVIQQFALRVCDPSTHLQQNLRDVNVTFGSRASTVRGSNSGCGAPADP